MFFEAVYLCPKTIFSSAQTDLFDLRKFLFLHDRCERCPLYRMQ